MTNQAIRKHVDNEDKLTRCFDGSGQNREMTIINALSRHYGVTVPLFVDNAEAVTRLESCGAQEMLAF